MEMKFDPSPVLVVLPLPENKTMESLQIESGAVRCVTHGGVRHKVCTHIFAWSIRVSWAPPLIFPIHYILTPLIFLVDNLLCAAPE